MKSFIQPGSPYYVGRTAEAAKLQYAVNRTNAVLLYGGRQAGKTSLLLHVQKASAGVALVASDLSAHDLFVYVDLTRMRYDATPAQFYALLASSAVDECRVQISGFLAPDLNVEYDLTGFIGALADIRRRCLQVDVRFVYLLDEAKRVLGERFPRGFQDNLFSLLFGDAAEQCRMAMVFAGTQHLNELLKDDTSPIGSRSLSVHIANLEAAEIASLVSLVEPRLNGNECQTLAEWIESLTGGQAGLTARVVEAHVALKNLEDVNSIADEIFENSTTLCENWVLSLTREASAVAAMIGKAKAVSIQEAAAGLEAKGLSKFLAGRAFEELEYLGLVRRSNDLIEKNNPLFWKFFDRFESSTVANPTKVAVWSLIEETELALRELIQRKLESRFGDGWEAHARKILGEEAWGKIVTLRSKSERQYKFSREHIAREAMSCMYLGQLGALMVHRSNWDLFKSPYRDKRELEDKIAAVMPVRNDGAHFSPAPPKELERCRIACDDLLAIAERELGERT